MISEKYGKRRERVRRKAEERVQAKERFNERWRQWW
jgi:hypothetical protein